MRFPTVTELPSQLERVEADTFLNPPSRERVGRGAARSGAVTIVGGLPAEPLGTLAVEPGEMRLRSRNAELAA